MYKIDKIKIINFWDNYTIETNLFDSVNIFIGNNGTGKTTLLNLINAVLTIDMDTLLNINFNKIILKLSSYKSKIQISVEFKETDNKKVYFKYKIRTKVFEIPYIDSHRLSFNSRYHTSALRIIENCKKEINDIISISLLSVNRDILDVNSLKNRRYSEVDLKSPIDSKLNKLISSLNQYYLNLENSSLNLVKRYQKDVLGSFLYEDKINLSNILESDINFNELKEGLINAYKDLGAFTPLIGTRIDKYIKSIQKSKELVSKGNYKNALELKDMSYIFTFQKIQKIVDLSKKLEDEKEKLFSPFMNYINELQKYLTGKDIDYSYDEFDSSLIKINKKGYKLNLEDLSSGEKQIFILLTETLLQQNKPFIFIADEPELSLHISWQRRLIRSIVDLNNNSQIIIATHSPEIAADWDLSLIEMENIMVENKNE